MKIPYVINNYQIFFYLFFIMNKIVTSIRIELLYHLYFKKNIFLIELANQRLL